MGAYADFSIQLLEQLMNITPLGGINIAQQTQDAKPMFI